MTDEPTTVLGVRLTAALRAELIEAARRDGFTNLSEWVRVTLTMRARAVKWADEA